VWSWRVEKWEDLGPQGAVEPLKKKIGLGKIFVIIVCNYHSHFIHTVQYLIHKQILNIFFKFEQLVMSIKFSPHTGFKNRWVYSACLQKFWPLTRVRHCPMPINCTKCTVTVRSTSVQQVYWTFGRTCRQQSGHIINLNVEPSGRYVDKAPPQTPRGEGFRDSGPPPPKKRFNNAQSCCGFIPSDRRKYYEIRVSVRQIGTYVYRLTLRSLFSLWTCLRHKDNLFRLDFRLPPRCWLYLRSSRK
jgi:hypothetical protein